MIDRIEQRIDKNNVIAYIGKFGTGKTTALEEYFKGKDKYKTIFFNAWEFDFSNDPKAVFINELLISLYKESGLKQQTKKNLHKALKVAMNITKNKLEQKGFSLKNDSLVDFDENIKNYKRESQKIKELKGLIQDIAKDIDGKVVIVIDDLDRARPDFALEIFEIAKHIFDVENISIILVYDKGSMDQMIQNKYGYITSGEGYLKKYIDSTITHDEVRYESVDPGTYSSNVFDIIIKEYSGNISIRTIVKFKEEYYTDFIVRLQFELGRIIVPASISFLTMIDSEIFSHNVVSNNVIFKNKIKIISILEEILKYFIKVGNKEALGTLEEFIKNIKENNMPEFQLHQIKNIPLKNQKH